MKIVNGDVFDSGADAILHQVNCQGVERSGRMPPKRGKVQPQFSSCVSDFCAMVEEAKRDYSWNYDEVGRLDRLTQDYLHMLELDNLSYKERAKVATKLRQCRKLRRQSKDTTEVLEPLITFLATDRGTNMMNLMKEVLGKTRKAEERMVGRTYRYKEHEPEVGK